jgi:hypothetical protein
MDALVEFADQERQVSETHSAAEVNQTKAAITARGDCLSFGWQPQRQDTTLMRQMLKFSDG